MRFLTEPVYCMTWIWTLHRAHNRSKNPMEEDNIWATNRGARISFISLYCRQPCFWGAMPEPVNQ